MLKSAYEPNTKIKKVNAKTLLFRIWQHESALDCTYPQRKFGFHNTCKQTVQNWDIIIESQQHKPTASAHMKNSGCRKTRPSNPVPNHIIAIAHSTMFSKKRPGIPISWLFNFPKHYLNCFCANMDFSFQAVLPLFLKIRCYRNWHKLYNEYRQTRRMFIKLQMQGRKTAQVYTLRFPKASRPSQCL